MTTVSKFYPFDRTNVFYNLQDWQSKPREIVESKSGVGRPAGPGALRNNFDLAGAGPPWKRSTP